MPRVRVTVVKRVAHADLQDEFLDRTAFPEAYGPCSIMKDGQSFTIEGAFPRKPEEFPCWDAWNDIQRSLVSVMYGGSLPWIKLRGTAVASCGDGMRPVSFKIERIDE